VLLASAPFQMKVALAAVQF
ncbi:hypothetical protein A2U01_0081430, partial [Trifolium medium]|nr:hypothetical protein [Trifolium medium]